MSWMASNFDKPDPTTATAEQMTRVIELLEADEVLKGGQAVKYRRNTGKTQVLLRKRVVGGTCVDTVELVE